MTNIIKTTIIYRGKWREFYHNISTRELLSNQNRKIKGP